MSRSNNWYWELNEVVSRYRDPHLQVGDNYSYLFNLRQNICKFVCQFKYCVPGNCALDG